MEHKIKSIKFNKEDLKICWRSDADLSVIDEIFVDKMYRSLEKIIPTLTNPILDIGAHIGLFSIYASKQNSKVKIIALEPEANNFELLKENIKLNHCKNVTTKQLALLPNNNNDATTKLYLNEDSHNHSTFYETENNIDVPAVNLERVLTKNKLNKIGLLKMDIEGGEFEIFKSFNLSIFQSIQYIAVEYHEFKNNKRSDLENIIRSKGFSVEHYPNPYDKRFGLFVCRNKKSP